MEKDEREERGIIGENKKDEGGRASVSQPSREGEETHFEVNHANSSWPIPPSRRAEVFSFVYISALLFVRF